MPKKAIVENGAVINIVEYAEEVGINGLRLPAGQAFQECTLFPVAIGDSFADGAFTRDGAPLSALETDSAKISALTELVDAMLIAQLTAEGAII